MCTGTISTATIYLSYFITISFLFFQIIPEDSAYLVEHPEEYDGVFHARFFRFGKWEDVYIDDYLPVIYGNTIWGAKSDTDKSEMWVALLEKAFAR